MVSEGDGDSGSLEHQPANDAIVDRADRIGGMAQPGFNRLQDSPLSLDEDLVRIFVAKLDGTRFSLGQFSRYLDWWRHTVPLASP